MERINEDAVELIDLGAASVETQGLNEGLIDGFGYQVPIGLSDN
ncbi:benenodin family lasso peptide [Sphingomonas sp. R647]|nr:benenodin family lasso peptide [Sphingomonas sp. R647]MCA1196500.1 benenodin family lasso peptide [Sphingomonas sp. R647]